MPTEDQLAAQRETENQEKIKTHITCIECGVEALQEAGCNNCGNVFNRVKIYEVNCYYCGRPMYRQYGHHTGFTGHDLGHMLCVAAHADVTIGDQE